MDKNGFSRETTINIGSLRELSDSFGLSYIENLNSLTVVGYEKNLVFSKHTFNNSEVTKCQLIEIY